jgi:hypothetical protein
MIPSFHQVFSGIGLSALAFAKLKRPTCDNASGIDATIAADVRQAGLPSANSVELGLHPT